MSSLILCLSLSKSKSLYKYCISAHAIGWKGKSYWRKIGGIWVYFCFICFNRLRPEQMPTKFVMHYIANSFCILTENSFRFICGSGNGLLLPKPVKYLFTNITWHHQATMSWHRPLFMNMKSLVVVWIAWLYFTHKNQSKEGTMLLEIKYMSVAYELSKRICFHMYQSRFV